LRKGGTGKRPETASSGPAKAPALHILLMGNMSAGKSTLVNALLGRGLLPSANAATTAKIFRLVSRGDIPAGKLYAAADGREVSKEDIRKYNGDGRDQSVELVGCFSSMAHFGRDICLYDTPGPNTALHKGHGAILREFIAGQSFSHILCVLDATVHQTDDEKSLLADYIAAAQSKNRGAKVVFLMNKVDALDEEREDPLPEVMASAGEWLKKHGFSEPILLPVMAKAAYILRAGANRADLSKDERRELPDITKRLNARQGELFAAAHMPAAARKEISQGLEPGFNYARPHIMLLLGIPFKVVSGTWARLVQETGLRTLELLLEYDLRRKIELQGRI